MVEGMGVMHDGCDHVAMSVRDSVHYDAVASAREHYDAGAQGRDQPTRAKPCRFEMTSSCAVAAKISENLVQAKLNTADPMRRLVYRVHRLPQAMLDYVWDYGQLAKRDEQSYIANMLSDSLLPQLEAVLVFASQEFIRREEEDCSVSLRDVRRFHKLVGWFFRTLEFRILIEDINLETSELKKMMIRRG